MRGVKDFLIALAGATGADFAVRLAHGLTGWFGPTDYSFAFGITFGILYYSRYPALTPRK